MKPFSWYQANPRQLYLIFIIFSFVLSKTTEAEISDEVDTDNERLKRDIACLRLRYRRIDGSCNNVDNPSWGQSGSPYLRFLQQDYADGRTEMRRGQGGRELPGARIVSLNLARDVNNEHPVISHMLMQWGQLINHDISKKRSKEVTCCDDGMTIASNNPECNPILLPSDDPAFRKRCLSFSRSDFVLVNGRREQINDVTSFVDASPVYGSTDNIARSLRTFTGGKLRSLPRPFGKELLPTMRSDANSFSSGDSRTNMLPSLVIVHVLLLREHNRLADELARLNPQWNDETLYQEARRIVSAEVQQITYREFLPMVLGAGNMRTLQLQNAGYFENYNPSLNPSIANGFAVAAYRFGHSLVQSHLKRFTLNVQELPSPPLAIEFFNVTSVLNRDGEVDRIILGLLNQKSQQADSSFSGQIQHNLFGTEGTGSDLIALNIQRARDHGIPGYNAWRHFCGLPRFTDFSELTAIMRRDVVNALQRLYNNVDDIDIYAAGMAEFPIQGGLVGPTFSCIIARQFLNLKVGDRYWYENGRHIGSFNPDQLREIRKVTLASIICDNTDLIKRIQPEVMNIPTPSNQLISCENLPRLDLRTWIEGQERENFIQQQPVNRDFSQQIKDTQRPIQQSSNRPEQKRPFTANSQEGGFQNSRIQNIPNENSIQNRGFSNIRDSQPFSPQQNDRRFPTAIQQQQEQLRQKVQQQKLQQERQQRIRQQNLQEIRRRFQQQQSFRQSENVPFQQNTLRNPQQGVNFQPNQFRNINQNFPRIIVQPFQQQFPNVSLNIAGPQSFIQSGLPLTIQNPQLQSFSPNTQTFPHQFSNFENQIEPFFNQLFGGQKPTHIFFTQGGQQSLNQFTKLHSLKPQPGVIFRVPGLSKDDDAQGSFGYIATF